MSSNMPPPRSLVLLGVSFYGKNKDGDYKWMIQQPKYKNALFIICENFLDMLSDDQAGGGGTACLRPYTMRGMGEGKMYRAAGIPTGWSTETQGFPCLDKHYTKLAIDLAFERLVLILEKQTDIDTVIYSCDADDHTIIGTNIFKDTIGRDVVKYISKSLHSLPGRLNVSTWTHQKLTDQEMRLYMYALLKHENAKLWYEVSRLKAKSGKMGSLTTGSGQITSYGQKGLLRLGASASAPPSSGPSLLKRSAAPPPPGPSLLGKRLSGASGASGAPGALSQRRATSGARHPFLK